MELTKDEKWYLEQLSKPNKQKGWTQYSKLNSVVKFLEGEGEISSEDKKTLKQRIRSESEMLYYAHANTSKWEEILDSLAKKLGV